MKFLQGLVFTAPLLLLTACGDEAAEPISAETGGEAAGEILGGTISDEMIPLEELISTSPPAAPRTSAASDDATAADESGEPQEPAGPVTAGPSAPVPQTQEAGEPQIDPPAF